VKDPNDELKGFVEAGRADLAIGGADLLFDARPVRKKPNIIFL